LSEMTFFLFRHVMNRRIIPLIFCSIPATHTPFTITRTVMSFFLKPSINVPSCPESHYLTCSRYCSPLSCRQAHLCPPTRMPGRGCNPSPRRGAPACRIPNMESRPDRKASRGAKTPKETPASRWCDAPQKDGVRSDVQHTEEGKTHRQTEPATESPITPLATRISQQPTRPRLLASSLQARLS